MGADGCASDPNVEGAKLDLRNKDYDRALENLDQALEKDPNNAEALELKGRVLQEKAFNVTDAQEHTALLNEMTAAYKKAMEVDPEMREQVQNQLAIAYFNEFQRGVQTFQKGQEDASQFMNAAIYFDNASMIAPDSAGAYANAAYAYINAGETERAIEPLEMAIEKGDSQADTYVILADLYRTYDQQDKAIMLLEQANEAHPDNEDVAAQLLNAYVTGGQMDRAMEAYQRQVDADPTNKLYRYNYGSLLLESEDYEAAIEQLSKAVELDPEYANAQYNLGAAYVNMAVAVNEEISAMDDEMRAGSATMSASEKQQMEAKMEEMAESRRELFANAIPPLEKARQLMDASGEDATGVCQALFSAYVQTGEQEKAESLAECAGYDLN